MRPFSCYSTDTETFNHRCCQRHISLHAMVLEGRNITIAGCSHLWSHLGGITTSFFLPFTCTDFLKASFRRQILHILRFVGILLHVVAALYLAGQKDLFSKMKSSTLVCSQRWEGHLTKQLGFLPLVRSEERRALLPPAPPYTDWSKSHASLILWELEAPVKQISVDVS